MADEPVMSDSNSILNDVKMSLGILAEDTTMDKEILTHINGAIGTLSSNGVGTGVFVTGPDQKWSDLKDPTQDSINSKFFTLAIQYIFVDVKIAFDPPMSSSLNALLEVDRQLIWRCNIEYSKPEDTTSEGR